jgi:hypothetical protein
MIAALDASRPSAARRPHRRIRVTLTVLMLGLSTASTSAATGYHRPSSDSGSGRPAYPGAPPASVIASLHLPIYDYRPTSEERAALAHAQGVLIRRCMEQKGFAYAVGNFEQESIDEAYLGPHGELRRYSVVDPGLAGAYGYTLPKPAVDAELNTKKEEAAARAALPAGTDVNSPAYQKALSGSGPGDIVKLSDGRMLTGGCSAAATRQIEQGLWGEAPLVSTIDHDSFDRSKDSPEVQAAVTKWSQCMATHGYHYADPLKAGDDLYSDARRDVIAPSAGPQEIQAAVIDVSCKQRVGLVKTWISVESRLEKALIAEHALELQEVRTHNANALRRAAEILSHG